MHYSLLVVGDNIEERLEPFDENLDVERHVMYTKEELIKQRKDRLEWQRREGPYSQYLKDPQAYISKPGLSQEHIRAMQNMHLEYLKTDEELYQDAISDEDAENIDPVTGGILTTCNENAKWDWYEIGGRWAGLIVLKDDRTPESLPHFSWGWNDEDKEEILAQGRVDRAMIKDIANLDELPGLVYSFLDENDNWTETHDDYDFYTDDKDKKEESENTFKENVLKHLKSLDPDTYLTIIDYHS